MTLAETTDRRVARHRPDLVAPVRQQRRPCAEACGGRGGLTAGVPPTDHHDIEPVNVHQVPPSSSAPAAIPPRRPSQLQPRTDVARTLPASRVRCKPTTTAAPLHGNRCGSESSFT
jgi:hypothetical protein